VIDDDLRERIVRLREENEQHRASIARYQIETYLDAFLPLGEVVRFHPTGMRHYPTYVVVAFSWGVYLDDGGKVRWRHRREMAFSLQDEHRKLIDEVMARRSYCDISICPNAMRDRHRRKGNSVWRLSAHADVDGGFNARMAKRVEDMPGGCAVNSGQPEHAHVYTVFSTFSLVTDPLDLANHEHLCRELGKWFEAEDPKVSDNDLMRLPGTFNFKPLAYDRDAEPLPVTWAVHPPTGGEYGRRIPSPTRVRQYMHIRKVRPGEGGTSGGAHGGGAGSRAETERVDLTWHLGVKAALKARTETGDPYTDTDRSVDTMRIVGACVDAGMTLPQTRWVVNQRDDLCDRVEARYDDDVERCFAKITASRDQNRREQTDLWPTPSKHRKRTARSPGGWR
jgi:hypothetical protein